MEGDEMEMTIEELEKGIGGQVKKNELISAGLLRKCNLLQSLLKRRENQAAHLLKLCESVAACEAIVKKQYSLLGWEYRDTDSDDDEYRDTDSDDDDDGDDDDDDDDDITGFGNTPQSPCDAQAARSPITNGPAPLLTKLGESENVYGDNYKKTFINLKRQPVVVLTRLPSYVVNFFRLPTTQSHDRDKVSSNYSHCDTKWEPDDSSDSDYSISNSSRPKRRKTDQNNEKLAKFLATTQADTETGARSKTMTTSTLPANTNVSDRAPVIVSSIFSCCSDEITKIRPDLPEEEVKVDMMVLARKRSMKWQRGKIVAIVTREDGRLKYKVSFEEKGKSLVSGHHIAFDTTPKLGQLYVGARVVVRCQDNKSGFQPGILAELPTRKNCLRFLVFLDDHIPVYVALPVLHLVCRPLEDVSDDIPNSPHKSFMKGYLKDWPYPHLTQCSVGQRLDVELNGVQQRCEVQLVDSSLIQVIFQDNQHQEWIHRGSIRLEHMARFLKMKGVEERQDD